MPAKKPARRGTPRSSPRPRQARGDRTAATVLGGSATSELGVGAPFVFGQSEGRALVDEGVIGTGGSGSVHRTYDPNLRRFVATKVLSQRLVKDPPSMHRFIEEARVMARLDHPNIVPVHDLVVEDRESGHIVMKLVRGRTLQSLVAESREPAPSGEALRRLLSILQKVCEALAFAHSRGVIHCDLKPENIMVGEFGEVYLMDWGIAAQKSPASGQASAPATATSRRKNTRGTPAYMSPEQAAGDLRATTEQTDIFGLGAVLYFILSRRAPFDARTATESLMLARASHCKDIEEVSEIAPPPMLARIVRKAMALAPRDRFASVLELHAAIDEVLRGDWSLPTKVFPRGTVILRQGDFADAAYIIVRGRCSVSKTIDGVERPLRTLESGAVFGETGVLSGDVRTATVRARTEVTVKVVTRDVFHGKLGGDTWLGKFVLALADRFRELDAEVAERGQGPRRRPRARD